jgi:opacity protein-like surface antigen
MLMLISVSTAQETSIAERSKALLFSFSGLSNLGANEFQGGIGGKYFLSNDMALRAGLQFATASQTIPANPPAGVSGQDGTVSALQLGVSGVIEYHLTRTRVSPYIGGGLGISYTTTESKNAIVGGGSQTTVKNDISGETIGGANFAGGMEFTIGAVAGVEFFVSKEVSLGAEYMLGFITNSRLDQEVSNGTTTTTTKTGGLTMIGIKSSGVLTLAVYF